MESIISLCHFCEQHGPCVVFSTQSHLKNSNFPPQHTSDGVASNHNSSDHSADSDVNQTETCQACEPHPDSATYFLSNDEESGILYVSARYPVSAKLTALVKTACIRSLSCEVCPGGEGCIYFGDESRGHVLSYTFSIKDVFARGLKRWYSFIILVKDKMLLLTFWRFYVENLKMIIAKLQARAMEIFDKEGGNDHPLFLESNRKQRSHPVTIRGFADLLQSKNIWNQLHSSNVWLMLAATKKFVAHGSSRHTKELSSIKTTETSTVGVRCLISTLGSHQFEVLLQHLFLGFPLLIKCSLPKPFKDEVVQSVTNTLKSLVPKFLHHMISKETSSVLSSPQEESKDSTKPNTSPDIFTLSDYSLSNVRVSRQSLDKIDLRLPRLSFDSESTASSSITINRSPSDRETLSQSTDVHDAMDLDALILHINLEGCDKERRRRSLLSDYSETEKLKKLSSCAGDAQRLLKLCVLKVEEGTGRAPSAPRRCSLIKDVTSACNNSALRDTTLVLMLRHSLQQWTNKAKLWSHLVKQNRVNEMTQQSPVKQCDSLVNRASTFTAPLLNKLKHRLGHNSTATDEEENTSSFPMKNLETKKTTSTPPLKSNGSRSLLYPLLTNLTNIASTDTSPSTSSLSTPTHVSSGLTDVSSSIGIAVPVLQRMLLAVTASEADVALLQCWAFHLSSEEAVS